MRRTLALILPARPAGAVPRNQARPGRQGPSRAAPGRSTGARRPATSIYRDSGRKEKVELRRDPVYIWTNPIRGGEQDGDVFVWTCRGRAEVDRDVLLVPVDRPEEPQPRAPFALDLGARRDPPRRGEHLDAAGPGDRAGPDRGCPGPGPVALACGSPRCES